MRELALHILDIAENSIRAGASLIHIRMDEAFENRFLRMEISDNGRGIPPSKVDLLFDPFVTSRTTRRVGLGLSLLREAARRCGGSVTLTSRPNQGTKIVALFEKDHIDLAPMGNMGETIVTLMAGYPEMEIDYSHSFDTGSFSLDTRELKQELDGLDITTPGVLREIQTLINQKLKDKRNQHG